MTLTDVKYTATVFSSVTKGRHISASGCCQYNSVVINATHCLFFLIDLELAAEIGKNLLERNKELEVMLKSSHQYLEEQTVKNEVSKINRV